MSSSVKRKKCPINSQPILIPINYLKGSKTNCHNLETTNCIDNSNENLNKELSNIKSIKELERLMIPYMTNPFILTPILHIDCSYLMWDHNSHKINCI